MVFLKLLLIVAVTAIAYFVFRPIRRETKAVQTTDRYGTSKVQDIERYVPKPLGIIGVIAAFVLSIIVVSGFGTVPNGYRAITCIWGAPTYDVKSPGIYWIMPIRDSVVPINVQVTSRSRTIEAASSDQQDVKAKITVNYRVYPERVRDLYVEYREAWLSETLDPAIEFWSKTATAQFTPNAMLVKRGEVAKTILDGLKSADQLKYFEIVAVNVENLEFSKVYTDAIEAKMVAEQKALEEENRLRQVKFEAEQAVERARAEAEKIRIQAEAIQEQGGAEYVYLQMIQKWNGVLPPTLIMGGDASSPFQILNIGDLIKK